jgi:hypothetical protein
MTETIIFLNIINYVLLRVLPISLPFQLLITIHILFLLNICITFLDLDTTFCNVIQCLITYLNKWTSVSSKFHYLFCFNKISNISLHIYTSCKKSSACSKTTPSRHYCPYKWLTIQTALINRNNYITWIKDKNYVKVKEIIFINLVFQVFLLY